MATLECYLILVLENKLCGKVGFTTSEKSTFKRQRVTRIGVTQGCLGFYCSLQPDNPEKAKRELLI